MPDVTSHSRAGTTCWLAVIAIAQAGAIALLHRFFVETAPGQRLEAAALAGNVIGRHYIEQPVRQILDIVSGVSILAAVAVIGFIALARRKFVLAVVAVIMVAGANLTTQLLKHGFLDRPELGVDPLGPDLPSLPSGHTTVGMSLAVALVLVVPPRARGTAALAGAAYAGLMGVATLSAGWHRPSDAIAANLVVGTWAALAGLYLSGSQPREARVSGREAHRVAVALLGLVGGGLLVVGGLTLVYAQQQAGVPVPELSRRALFVSYTGGAAAIAGTAAIVVGLVTSTLHRVIPEYPNYYRPEFSATPTHG